MATGALTMEQDTDAIEQMAQAAHENIAELESSIEALDTKIAEAQAELEALDVAHVDRSTRLTDMRTHVAHLATAQEQAIAYAKLAHKTPNEGRAIKEVSTAKKAAQAAQKELDALERETAQADQADQARAEDISKHIHLFNFEKETHQAEMVSVESGQKKVLAELGTQRHASIMAGYHERLKKVNDLQEQLIAAQVDLHDFHEYGLENVKAWPDLHKSVVELLPLTDSTTRLLEVTLQYIDVYLHDREKLRLEFPHPSVSHAYGLWDYLFIPAQQLQWAHGELKDRRNIIQCLLNDYRAHLLKEAGERNV